MNKNIKNTHIKIELSNIVPISLASSLNIKLNI
ncbi:hypothetical protein M2325_001400 [Methanococcus voltae PS]|uniref:Uncharacterized protein n=1 Tax=Methanococcus voltae PS TaxID=523842 RepID=A0ABT2EYE3_METVO|nr:hypothetical protein [Methanococcus voltae PS]